MEMNKYYCKILKRLKDKSFVDIATIQKKIRFDCKGRITELCKAGYVKQRVERGPRSNAAALSPTLVFDEFQITEAGIIALEDFTARQRKDRFRFWFPILVSFSLSIASFIKSFFF